MARPPSEKKDNLFVKMNPFTNGKKVVLYQF